MRWRFAIAAALGAAALLFFVVMAAPGSAQDDDDVEATATAAAEATGTAAADATATAATGTVEPMPVTTTAVPTTAPTPSTLSTTVERFERGDPLQGYDMLAVIMSALVGSFIIIVLINSTIRAAIEKGSDLQLAMAASRIPLEAITIVLIVVAVLILASGNRIDPQASVGILTAIVGYILGRAVGGGGGLGGSNAGSGGTSNP